MYYTSNHTNNDYYSSYKQNMQEDSESNLITKIMKLGLFILVFALLPILIIYLVNHFSTKIEDSTLTNNIETNILVNKSNSLEENTLEQVELTKELLPQSIQLQESTSQKISQIKLNATDTLEEESEIDQKTEAIITNKVSQMTDDVNINPKDIALIVEIIMAQMNNNPEQTLEEQLINAQEQKMVKQNLKDVNHYNKVVIESSKQEEENPSELMQLRSNLNNMMDESTATSTSSEYSKAITKEISVRSNEMKIIIVKKGDTLSKIAKKAYGDKDAYRKIFIANPEVLKNPDEIFVGQKLRIPS